MSANGRSCLETKAGPTRLWFATDIDSQGRTNAAARLPRHAPGPRITRGVLQVTVPPECGCDDDEAGNAPSGAVCDLRPQKNIFDPPFRDAFWWREQRMYRAILPAASRGRTLSHSPHGRVWSCAPGLSLNQARETVSASRRMRVAWHATWPHRHSCSHRCGPPTMMARRCRERTHRTPGRRRPRTDRGRPSHRDPQSDRFRAKRPRSRCHRAARRISGSVMGVST